ncbi:unnamed protein product [Amoebophrya sp. A120]|nr:unnamed protein product [Amoebophrya sp. A120]|eukprot:GSA120T00012508001.1
MSTVPVQVHNDLPAVFFVHLDWSCNPCNSFEDFKSRFRVEFQADGSFDRRGGGKIEEFVEQEWQKCLSENPKCWNGTKFRFHRYYVADGDEKSGDGGEGTEHIASGAEPSGGASIPTIQVGLTDFRAFVGTTLAVLQPGRVDVPIPRTLEATTKIFYRVHDHDDLKDGCPAEPGRGTATFTSCVREHYVDNTVLGDGRSGLHAKEEAAAAARRPGAGPNGTLGIRSFLAQPSSNLILIETSDNFTALMKRARNTPNLPEFYSIWGGFHEPKLTNVDDVGTLYAEFYSVREVTEEVGITEDLIVEKQCFGLTERADGLPLFVYLVRVSVSRDRVLELWKRNPHEDAKESTGIVWGKLFPDVAADGAAGAVEYPDQNGTTAGVSFVNPLCAGLRDPANLAEYLRNSPFREELGKRRNEDPVLLSSCTYAGFYLLWKWYESGGRRH